MILIGNCNFENGILCNLSRLMRSTAPKQEWIWNGMEYINRNMMKKELMEVSGDDSDDDLT